MPVLIAQHNGVSTYVPTNLKPASSLCFPRAAIQPSVSPIPTSISLFWRDVIICPVPEGNGMRVAERLKYLWAK